MAPVRKGAVQSGAHDAPASSLSYEAVGSEPVPPTLVRQGHRRVYVQVEPNAGVTARAAAPTCWGAAEYMWPRAGVGAAILLVRSKHRPSAVYKFARVDEGGGSVELAVGRGGGERRHTVASHRYTCVGCAAVAIQSAGVGVNESPGAGPPVSVVGGMVYGDADTGHEPQCRPSDADDIGEQKRRRRAAHERRAGRRFGDDDGRSEHGAQIDALASSKGVGLRAMLRQLQPGNGPANAPRPRATRAARTQTCAKQTRSSYAQAGNRPWYGRRCTWAVINRAKWRGGLHKASQPFTWISLDRKRHIESAGGPSPTAAEGQGEGGGHASAHVDDHAAERQSDDDEDECALRVDDDHVDVELDVEQTADGMRQERRRRSADSASPPPRTAAGPLDYAALYNETQELKHVLRIVEKRARCVASKALEAESSAAVLRPRAEDAVCLPMPSEWLHDKSRVDVSEARSDGSDSPPMHLLLYGGHTAV